MPLSLSTIAWDPAENGAVIAMLQRHNLAWIDLAPGKVLGDVFQVSDSEINALRCWWAERGIGFLAMQSLLYGSQGLNLFAEAAVQRRMLAHLQQLCRIAEGLAVRRLVFGCHRQRDCRGLPEQQALEIATAFFHQLASLAEGHGVTFCLEPIPRAYGATFLTTSAETARLVQAVAHPALKMQFDTGAITVNGEDPAAICAQFQSLIGHAHASDPQLGPVGFGLTDHRACAAALAQHLPGLPVTIEMLTDSLLDPLAVLEASIARALACYAPDLSSPGLPPPASRPAADRRGKVPG
jgi:D-psicose/D-tagatose/L-ribulose 3-epimerase